MSTQPSDGALSVNLDADPFVPDGCSVEEHRRGGTHEFDPAKVGLYFSERQEGNGMIEGNKLREELSAQPVYNANLLDWFHRYENQHFIPKTWRRENVFFWGTIYRHSDGRLYVRCLSSGGFGRMSGWKYRLLDGVWRSGDPAAVFAK